jgi:predicted nucleotidyltransferase
MTRNETIAALREQASAIRDQGVTSLYLFGSSARDEARADSDVDLFVDYDPDRFSFVELIRLRESLTRKLGRKADLTTRAGLHPVHRRNIEAEAIRVF